MALPSIKITLPLLFVLWLAGAYAAGMTALWAYPLMWGGVAAVFGALHVATTGGTAKTGGTATTGGAPAADTSPEG
ncbi:MAG: hypothetical protein AAGG46_09785 [Planctomycetota bacterium]